MIFPLFFRIISRALSVLSELMSLIASGEYRPNIKKIDMRDPSFRFHPTRIDPNVAKAESVVDPRHGDAVPSAFPKGKQHDDETDFSGKHI